jgi:hypothetical protein
MLSALVGEVIVLTENSRSCIAYHITYIVHRFNVVVFYLNHAPWGRYSFNRDNSRLRTFVLKLCYCRCFLFQSRSLTSLLLLLSLPVALPDFTNITYFLTHFSKGTRPRTYSCIICISHSPLYSYFSKGTRPRTYSCPICTRASTKWRLCGCSRRLATLQA